MSESHAKLGTKAKPKQMSNTKKKVDNESKDGNNNNKKVTFDLSSLKNELLDIESNDTQNANKTAKTGKKLVENVKLNNLEKQVKRLDKNVDNSVDKKLLNAVSNTNLKSQSIVKTKKKLNEELVDKSSKPKQLPIKVDNSILWQLFVDLDKKYFDGYLASNNVIVKWTNKMFIAAGVTLNDPVEIRISAKLHKILPHKDLVETLLHEMIHAFLMIEKVPDNHGPQFLSHMKRINNIGKFNITVGHNYKEEMDKYKEERRKKKMEREAEKLKN